jgi:hypothetical protein
MDKKTHDIVDGLNSALWFLMDGCYLFGWNTSAYFLITPVIATAMFSLLSGEKRADVFFSTLALNCWVLMNCFWLVGDMETIPVLITVAKVLFFVGAALVVMSMTLAGDWRKTVSSFKRMRIK